jgi:hypothetical protein
LVKENLLNLDKWERETVVPYEFTLVRIENIKECHSPKRKFAVLNSLRKDEKHISKKSI